MNRITVGTVREKSNNETKEQPVLYKSGFGEDAVTALGLCMLCLMLLIPVSRDVDSGMTEDAVAVMSTNVSDAREVLREIDEPASADPGEDSVFDYIGELFAHLIFGE